MNELTEKKSPTVNSHEPDDFIAGKSLTFYWKVGRYFAIFLFVLVALNEVWNIYIYGRWIVGVLVFILFNWWIFKRWKLKMETAITASIFMGLMAGLLIAVFEIIWYHKWWYFLNLIRNPFIIVVLGVIVSIVFYLLFQNIKSDKKTKNLKGGGIYGRRETSFDKFR